MKKPSDREELREELTALEKELDDTRRAWGVKAKFLRDLAAKVEEYCEEAEHQDGCTYWVSYDTEDFLEDFALYIQNSSGSSCCDE